jgi:hypothetical protein
MRKRRVFTPEFPGPKRCHWRWRVSARRVRARGSWGFAPTSCATGSSSSPRARSGRLRGRPRSRRCGGCGGRMRCCARSRSSSKKRRRSSRKGPGEVRLYRPASGLLSARPDGPRARGHPERLYAWARRPPSARAEADARLRVAIRAIHAATPAALRSAPHSARAAAAGGAGERQAGGPAAAARRAARQAEPALCGAAVGPEPPGPGGFHPYLRITP